jgi:hypothetical protein
MTTVGYGDKIPVTIFGKFVTALSAIFGISTMSLYFINIYIRPVAIIGNIF